MNPPAPKELYGLIGWPVKHSYSALMHNAAFKHYGMDAVYELFEVAPKDLDIFFKKTIPEKKIRGFNVTVPHKQEVLPYLLGRLSAEAKMIGAVNTVVARPDGTLDGFNTDGAGFLKDLESQGLSIRGKDVALIGAGGGARAVAFSLAAQDVLEIRIFDADRSRAEELVKDLRAYYHNVTAVRDLQKLDIPDTDLLVNATPVGMKSEDPLLVEKDWLRPALFVYDLIYNPAQTKLLATAREAGCRTANGLGMLLYQGALAFEHWTGKTAPVEVMRQTLEGVMRA
jgi:shikimate dehydrogenase